MNGGDETKDEWPGFSPTHGYEKFGQKIKWNESKNTNEKSLKNK